MLADRCVDPPSVDPLQVKALIRTGGGFSADTEAGATLEYLGGDTKLVSLPGDAQFSDVMGAVERVANAASITSASALHMGSVCFSASVLHRERGDCTDLLLCCHVIVRHTLPVLHMGSVCSSALGSMFGGIFCPHPRTPR